MRTSSKKRFLSAMLTLVMCLSVLTVIPSTVSAAYEAYFLDGTVATEATFILDPGHGGDDSGALGPDDGSGVRREEADDNLAMALEVAKQLEARGETVALTRITDKTVALIDRSYIANAGNYQIFCSLHRNSYNESSKGLSTFYYNALFSNSASEKIATAVHNKMMACSSDIYNRGVKTENFSVLRETDTCAILIETLFISNPDDNILYDQVKDKFAVAIAEGLIESKPYAVNGECRPADLGTSFTAAIVNPATGMALTNEGTYNVGLSKAVYDESQLWTFEMLDSANSYKQNAYRLQSHLDSRCLDIASAGTADGTNVMVWDDNGGDCQRYYFYEINGNYFIRPVHCTNERVIDFDTSTNNSYIQLINTSSTTQQFQIIKEEDIPKDDTSIEDTPSVSDKKLELNESSKYSLGNAFVSKVISDTTISSFAGNFKHTVNVSDQNGAVVTDSAKVGTGYTVTEPESGESATVVILGDINGDGAVDSTDYLRIKSAFLGKITLDGAYFSAADVDGSTVIDSTDYLKVKSHFLAIINLFDFSDDSWDTSSEDTTSEDTTSEDASSGVESESRTNYALGKTYTTNGSFLSGKEDNGTILTDGYAASTETSGATVAFTGTGATSSVTVNLGSIYVDIDEINVCGVIEGGNRQYGTVTLEISTNGATFTTLTDYQTLALGGKYSYRLNSKVSAMFVRVTFVSSTFVLAIGEIEVYGGNAESVAPTIPEAGGTDKLYLADNISNLWTTNYVNETHMVYPGQYVQGLYQYKLVAEYSAVVDGYIVTEIVASHRNLYKQVSSTGIAIVFAYDPSKGEGRTFGKEQFKVWSKIRPGDILRPSGIDFTNKTLDLTGTLEAGNLVTNAYFTVEYIERTVPTTKYNDMTIVALGDSVTANGGWTEAVSDRIGTYIINSGVGGDRTTEALKRFDADVTTYNPDIVLIMFGINDCIQYYYDATILETYRSELLQLCDKCAAIGAKVVYMAPNDINIASLDYDRYAAYGGLATVYPQFIQTMKNVAASVQCPLVDIYSQFHSKSNVKDYLCDTVHPNDAGYDIFNDTIANYLLDNQDWICG